MYNSVGFRICTKLHSCPHSQLQNILIPSKSASIPISGPQSFPALGIHQCTFRLWIYLSGHFLSVESYTVAFCVWPLFTQCSFKVHSCCMYQCFISSSFSFKDLFIYLLFGFYLFFILCFIYLLLTVLGLRCCVWAFFTWGERDRSLVGVRSTGSRHAGVSSGGSQAPGHRLSSCVHGLRFPAACGTFPDQRRNPCPLHLQAHSLPLSHQGSPIADSVLHCVAAPHFSHLFTSSSLFGFFCFLAIANDATVNINVQVFVWTCDFTSLGYVYLRVKLLGHLVTLCVTLEAIPDCFPKWLHHFSFSPVIMHKDSSFATSSPTLDVSPIFFNSLPSGCGVVSHSP